MTAARTRASLAIADQVFSSASNFLVGVVVARLAGPEAFGAFALAFAVWLVAAGMHRSLVINPVMIAPGGAREPGTTRLDGPFAAELLLGLGAGAVVALAGGILWLTGARPLATALLTLAPGLVVLLVQDFWRWAGFMRGEPGKALANDVVFTAAQVGLLVVLRLHGEVGLSAAIVTWEAGALAGALLGVRQFGVRQFGVRQFGVRPRPREGVRCLRDSWGDGRWLLADFATSYASSQLYLYLVAGMLGSGALGLLRAAQNLMGPSNVLLLGGSSYGLPACAEAFRARGWAAVHPIARRLTAGTTAAIGLYAAVVVLAGGRLVDLVYGDQYAGIGTLILLACLQPVAAALGWGSMLALTAGRRTRQLFLVRVASAVTSVAAVLVLARPLGTAGAAWAGVGGAGVSTLLMTALYRRARRQAAAPTGEDLPMAAVPTR